MQLRISQSHLKASAISVLAFFCLGQSNVAFATDASLPDGPRIQKALTDHTAYEADSAKRPWRQYFGANGSTIYFGDGPETFGRWEVRGNQFCSFWPPAPKWTCYDVVLDMDDRLITWFPKEGAPISAFLFEGDTTSQTTAPKQ